MCAVLVLRGETPADTPEAPEAESLRTRRCFLVRVRVRARVSVRARVRVRVRVRLSVRVRDRLSVRVRVRLSVRVRELGLPFAFIARKTDLEV